MPADHTRTSANPYDRAPSCNTDQSPQHKRQVAGHRVGAWGSGRWRGIAHAMVVKLWLVLLSTTPVFADPPTEEKPADTAANAFEGFWPTEKMTRGVLARWLDEAADDLKLDEGQQAKLLEGAVERWPKFLKENRAEFQPLINEFVEMHLSMEPPAKEQVQAWSDRMLPAFQKIRGQLNAGIEDVRGVLNPLQRAQFEADVLKFGAGLQIAEAKINQWQRGEYDEGEFWDPPRSERRRRREARKAAENMDQPTPEPEPVDQVAQELAAWERYVEEFIRLYDLDESQRGTAKSCLKELTERAVAYRDRNQERIQRLEARIARNDGSEEQLAEIKEQLVAIYGPIDDMFKELQRRLESIPTTQQRENVANKGKESD